jgi:ABC-2 type transport system ATP-binding protein
VSAPVIEIRSLTKRFGALTAVDDVSFDVRAGEVFGLLGPNGSGKTTTLRCLLGMIRPSAGESSLFGLDAWSERVQAHGRIGVLPSDFDYEGEVTGGALVRLFGLLRGVDTDAPAAALAERLRADLGRPLKQLSRGNRQKIGLICALAHDPELVIMDEPTAGLDPLMQEEFLMIVDELRAAGRTVLLSSHNMAEVERCCDRVAMIREGALLDVSEVSSLLARSPKEVRAVFAEPVDASEYTSIEGVDGVVADGATLHLTVGGSLDAVIRAAARHEIVDFECGRPSLETAFVQLYRDGEGGEQ